MVVIGVCAALIAWTINQFVGEPPWWLDLPTTPLAVYGLLVQLMKHALWRFPPFQWMGVSARPFSGSWQGVVTTSHDKHATRHKVEVNIKQTWTSVSVNLRSENSSSDSFAAAYTEQREPEIHYLYRNEPASQALDTMHAHHGAARLRLVSADQLEGEYFSGRARQNHGAILLQRTR